MKLSYWVDEENKIENQEEGNKKISLPEAIIMILMTGVADIFGVVAGMSLVIPVIGQILIFFSLIFSLSVFLITQFWLIIKGVKGWTVWTYAGTGLMDVILGGVFPLQTPFLLLAIVKTNSPLAAKIAGAVQGEIKE